MSIGSLTQSPDPFVAPLVFHLFRKALPAVVLGGLILRPALLDAQPPPASGITALMYEQRADSMARLARAEAGDSAAEGKRDPCTPAEVSGNWLDWLQRKVSTTTCGSALWFDGLFGDSNVYDEYDTTYGRIFLGLWWDRRDKLDPKFRFRIKVAFPQLENRVSIVFGRENADDFITDQIDVAEGRPESLAGEDEESWLLGLGYSPVVGARSRLSFDVGVKIDVPPAPYVKTHYRINIYKTDKSMARFRETLFWTGDDGFGTTTRIDFEQNLSERLLLREILLGTVSQSTLGLDWQTSVTLYHYLGGSRALAYFFGLFGETGRPVPLEDYELRAVYRQGAFRPWLFIELSAGVSWPRKSLEETRRINPGVGIGFEMQYGRTP
jgi:hypothetical protein